MDEVVSRQPSLPGLEPARFYGQRTDELYREREKKIEEARKRRPADLYDRPKSLLYPSRFNKEFWKQSEALACVAENSQDDDILCCFVFQDESERRRFIVSYPEDFWVDCEHVPPEKRVFYEVIPELTPCFLYYDLEFEVDLNEEKNGVQMSQTLIDITCAYIAKLWNCPCDRSSVINLDSSRRGKFSKHLIFSTQDFAFLNNYHVGILVKMIYSDLVDYVLHESSHHEILSKFCMSSLQELFVETSKGKKLFVDLNVYTKNRHFRIYKATKWGKHSHLKQAPECQYARGRKSKKTKDADLFLHSLISYLPRKHKLKLLSFDQDKKSHVLPYSQHYSKPTFNPKESVKSPYPVLDRYVSEYVQPGKVRDTKYVEAKQLIFYEVVGNRYCENIGRWHKSNNVFFVVDLVSKVMVQKCHDEDCANFVSAAKPLPDEVTFYFQDEIDTLFVNINDP